MVIKVIDIFMIILKWSAAVLYDNHCVGKAQ